MCIVEPLLNISHKPTSNSLYSQENIHTHTQTHTRTHTRILLYTKRWPCILLDAGTPFLLPFNWTPKPPNIRNHSVAPAVSSRIIFTKYSCHLVSGVSSGWNATANVFPERAATMHSPSSFAFGDDSCLGRGPSVARCVSSTHAHVRWGG